MCGEERAFPKSVGATFNDIRGKKLLTNQEYHAKFEANVLRMDSGERLVIKYEDGLVHVGCVRLSIKAWVLLTEQVGQLLAARKVGL